MIDLISLTLYTFCEKRPYLPNVLLFVCKHWNCVMVVWGWGAGGSWWDTNWRSIETPIMGICINSWRTAIGLYAFRRNKMSKQNYVPHHIFFDRSNSNFTYGRAEWARVSTTLRTKIKKNSLLVSTLAYTVKCYFYAVEYIRTQVPIRTIVIYLRAMQTSEVWNRSVIILSLVYSIYDVVWQGDIA